MLFIRKIVENDLSDLFIWRNDVVTRKMFKNNRKVTFSEHQIWFNKSLINPNKILYICHNKFENIGVIIFDINSDSANLSININPNFRHKGHGFKCLKLAINKFKKENIKILYLFAEIRKINENSIKMFQKIGFKFFIQNKEYNKYIFKI